MHCNSFNILLLHIHCIFHFPIKYKEEWSHITTERMNLTIKKNDNHFTTPTTHTQLSSTCPQGLPGGIFILMITSIFKIWTLNFCTLVFFSLVVWIKKWNISTRLEISCFIGFDTYVCTWKFECFSVVFANCIITYS